MTLFIAYFARISDEEMIVGGVDLIEMLAFRMLTNLSFLGERIYGL